jgi:hypothetical protein
MQGVPAGGGGGATGGAGAGGGVTMGDPSAGAEVFNFDPGYAVYNQGQQTGILGAGPTAPATPATTGPQTFMQGLTGNYPGATAGGSWTGQLGKALGNPLTDLGILGTGYNLLQGYQGQQQLKALQQQETDYQNRIAQAGQASLSAAGPILSTGQAIMSGGPLPPTVQAMFDQYTNSAKAQIIQGYGARNQPTDPMQNSALQQDLSAVDRNVLSLREQIGKDWIATANTLITSGTSSTQIAAELPIMMQNLNIKLQTLTGNAIANFAAAMSGGTMKVAGAGAGQNLNITTSGNPLLTG